jgi:hypothetical protein
MTRTMLAMLFAVLFLVVTDSVAPAQLSPPAVGEMAPLTFKSEQEPVNVLTGGVAIVGSYDDNVLLNNANRMGDETYEIRPRMSFTLSRKHLNWSLNFSPGLTIHQQLSQRDLLTNAFGTDVQYSFTKRLTARFRGSFLIQNDPLSDTGVTSSPTPAFSLLDQSNSLVITPQVKRTGEQADMGFTYTVDKRTTLEATGTFYKMNFQNFGTDTSTALTNSLTASGRALYNHRLSRRHSAGFIYNFQDLATFGGKPARTLSHDFLYSHSIDFTHSTSLQTYAGPEYSRTHEILVLPSPFGQIFVPFTWSAWSWAGGAILAWQGNHTSARATFRHQVQNGGGLPTAARHTSGTLELRRTLVVGWMGGISAGYGENKLLSFETKSSTQSYAASASLRHKMGRDFWLDFRFSRGHQRGRGDLINRTGDVDRATVSLEYQFKHPLGR